MQAQTGKYCRLAQLPSTYPLNRPVTQISSFKSSKSTSRGLLQVPSSCATQGVLCDLDSPTGATILTYTGYGMSYNGVPLVQSPNSQTLLLSSDPACTVPGGDQMTFPPANLCERLQQRAAVLAKRGRCRRLFTSVTLYCSTNVSSATNVDVLEWCNMITAPRDTKLTDILPVPLLPHAHAAPPPPPGTNLNAAGAYRSHDCGCSCLLMSCRVAMDDMFVAD